MIRGDRDYLRSLVRMDIRAKERGLEKLRRRDDQSEEEFRAFRQGLGDNLAFRRGVLERLGEEPK